MNRHPATALRVWGLAVQLVLLVTASSAAARKPTEVGPATEKRFPPLVVPDGFSSTLFACDPLVEYPSVISIGPRPGTLLVAHDYVTGLGVKIVRRDEVRLIADTVTCSVSVDTPGPQPMQAPQPGGIIVTPAFSKASRYPWSLA